MTTIRATYPIAEIYLPQIEVFGGWKDYAARTGNRAPEKNIFNPSLPLKYWRDMSETTKRVLVYSQVLATDAQGKPLLDLDGRPYFEPMTMSMEDAQKVNMAIGSGDDPAWQPVRGSQTIVTPVPCRALFPWERIEFGSGLMGSQTVVVRDLRIKPDSSVDVGFTQGDRDLLTRIAEKLGA